MTDIIGITSALDHIIYMTLNVIATLLWRLDAAIIGMSLYSYGTQDWLTGNSGGGVWGVLEWLIGSGGLAGTTTWTLFGALALMLWGLAKIAKPFISFQPVDIGKLLIFFVLSYTVISQGTTLMPAIEEWREGAGGVVYEAIAGSDAAVIDVPAPGGSTDVLGAPSDLDGTGVIRGWEAVATSYFLVTDASDLHRSYPPDQFLQAYCLYNPELPINTQNVTNTAGCSPMLAWDEWNNISIDILQESYGIDLDPILTPIRDFFAWFGIDFDFTTLITTVPVIRHDPLMRELGNRQAQAGIARLAMGIIIALFPMVEANISLMLALAASFIYITLPIALLFGFFLPTESMVNRLFMQFAAVVLRTIIIQGVVALFMLMLTNTAATGSLTAYFGLVGVGLIGGWVLMGIATSTMKETFSQSVGAVSSVWMGSATGLLGQGAAAPAAAVLGAAKLAGGGALLATAAMNHSLTSAWDLSNPASDVNRSGMDDLRYGAPGAAAFIDKQRGRLPEPLSRLTAQLGLATGAEAEAAGKNGVDPLAFLPGSQLAAQFGLTAGGEAADQRQASTNGQSGRNGGGQPGRQPLYDSEPSGAGRWGAMAMAGLAAPGLAAAGLAAGMMGGGTDQRTAKQQRNAAVDQWMGQTYKARETQTGQKRASETGRSLLGEELAWKAERAMERHTPAEVSAVVAAARAAAEENGQGDLVKNGRLTKKAVEEVQKRLDPEAAKAFQGDKGAWDLAALTAVGLQERKQAEPEEFRQAMAKSKSGWGENSPAHKVPKELGLDPVAAGSSYTAMNRFARLADNAHLSEKQREQLLKEAQTGKVSDKTRAELEKTIAEQQKQGRAQGLTADALIAGAAAVPATIAGPQQVWTTPAKPQVQGTGDPQQANLGMELKNKDKKKGTLAEAVTDTVAGVVGVTGTVAGAIPGVGDAAEVIGEGAAGVLRTGVRVGEGKYQEAAVELAVGAARTAVAAAPISILTGPAKYAADKGVRYAAQQVQGGEPGSGRAGGQAAGSGGGRPGHIVEPMVAAPTMASASGASRSTGEPGSRSEPGQGAGFGQELKAASMGQAPGSAPAGRASSGDGNAQAGNAPVNRAPIAGGSPGLTGAPAAGPSAGATPNMTAPIGVSSSPASYSSTPGGPGQGSGFSQELRDAAQGPASIGGASFAAGVPVIDLTSGAAQAVYGGGEPAPGSGSGREQRPLWEQQQAPPPPVSNPPPMTNQPAVDFSAGRAPIGNMTPNWSSDQQPPAAAAPAVDFSANMGIPAAMGGPASFSSGSGLGQGSGFSQELRDAVQDPFPSVGGGSLFADVPVMDNTPGAAPTFYGGSEPAPGSGPAQEYQPMFWEQQQAPPPPVSNPPPMTNQPAVDFSAGRAPIGNMTPDWSSDQQPPAAAAPTVDFSANMGIPAAMGGPASFSSGSGLGQGSGFSQELRDAVQDPFPPMGGGSLFADVPVMDNNPGGAAPVFYGGSEPIPGSGPAQEYRPFWEQQQPAPPPPVSSPPPMTNQPAVDFSANRAPIGNMTPNWSSDQQPPAAAAPAVDFSGNMGVPAAMGGPASFSSGSGLGQGSGFSQELRDAVQDPSPIGGGMLFADVPVMDNNPGGGAAPVFYGSNEPAPGSGPGQEYRPFWEQQPVPPPPVSSPPPMTNQPAVDFSANRAPIGNMTPDWSSNQQPPAATAPAVDFSGNMGIPSAMGGPASFSSGSGLGQSSGFSQELRETAQSPSPIGGAQFNDAPAIGSTPGAAPTFYGGSEPAPGSGPGQERRPMSWEQQQAPPPPVSSPPPMTNRSAGVDYSAARAPINSMAPDWSPNQPPPAANAPATNFAPTNMGAPANVGGTTAFSSAGSGLGQNSGFGQELRAAAPNPTPAASPMSSPPVTPPPAPAPMPSQPVTPPPAPAPMPSQPVTPPPAPAPMPSQPVSPPQPARQPIGSATGGAPAAESMAPPPRTNPASASTPPISTPPVMPPTGQSVTPPPPQPAQRPRSGGGVAAPVQPPPARTSATGPAPSASVQPPPVRTPVTPPAQTSTPSTTEPKKTSPRGGSEKKESKGKKG